MPLGVGHFDSESQETIAYMPRKNPKTVYGFYSGKECSLLIGIKMIKDLLGLLPGSVI